MRKLGIDLICMGGGARGEGDHVVSSAARLALPASDRRRSEAVDPSATTRTVDGDTLELNGQRVRIWGVDAPEGALVCGQGGGVTRQEMRQRSQSGLQSYLRLF